MTDRYLLPYYGPNNKALSAALIAAVAIAQKFNTTLTICVPALRHAESTILENILSPKLLRNLVKGKICKIEGVLVSMKSTQTFHPVLEQGVVVCLWASEKMLVKVDHARNVKSIIVLPSIESDSKLWSEKWSPKVLLLEELFPES